MLDRGTYWQCAYLIGKGRDETLRAANIDQLHRSLVSLLPWMAGRVDHLASWNDVKLLNVQLNRVRRWDRDGLLLIGDAAHAMSPVGGFGINLAVADAVAAARLLSHALRGGAILPRRLLRRVQRRRWWTTVLLQCIQQIAHKAVANDAHAQQNFEPPAYVELPAWSSSSPACTSRLPLPVRVMQRWPILQRIPGWLVAIGPRPEHAPVWARRPPMSVMHR
jgi:2-polyprenyl-6-methoxyphenol hydroxylase-like FAD-dependent oxidoreductase